MRMGVTAEWLASQLNDGHEPDFYTSVPKTDTTRCQICHHKTKPAPIDERDVFWECSHVECPNRHQVTAAPSDRPPTPKD